MTSGASSSALSSTPITTLLVVFPNPNLEFISYEVILFPKFAYCILLSSLPETIEEFVDPIIGGRTLTPPLIVDNTLLVIIDCLTVVPSFISLRIPSPEEEIISPLTPYSSSLNSLLICVG